MEEHDRERSTMDDPAEGDDDPTARREADAAAAEAGQIGGAGGSPESDEAARPVEEAGGGVAEGFEESERELVEQAQHGEQTLSPEADAFPPEEESDQATSVYGEPDEVDPTEVRRDPREGPDDPGAGTDIAPDR